MVSTKLTAKVITVARLTGEPTTEGLNLATASPLHTASDHRVSASRPPETQIERLRAVRETVLREAEALQRCGENLSPAAVEAAERTATCRGSVIVTGIGKAGWIGQKIAATLASTGCPAHFLHPAEAIHGDLGRVRGDDVVWAFSNSGRSGELLSIASHLRANSSGLISITAGDDNPLAAASDCVVAIGKHGEACPNGLAPTSSTTAMLAVGDAIAMLASQLRRFTAQDFARFHPGGSLGQKLAKVDEIMRPVEDCRVARQDTPIRQAMVMTGRHGRRSGAVLLTNRAGQLSGIFTDSDLARLLQSRRDADLDRPIEQLMTKSPSTILHGELLQDAIAVLSKRRISELPVVDESGMPMGIVDITDVIGQDASPQHTGPPSVKLSAVGLIKDER